MAMGHALLQSLVNKSCSWNILRLIIYSAEFRGPGVHHTFDDSDHSGFEQENGNQRSQTWGNSRGQFILSGNNIQFLTDSDDTEMFDREDEEKDLDNQVTKSEKKESAADKADTLPEKLDPEQFKNVVEKRDALLPDDAPGAFPSTTAESEKKE